MADRIITVTDPSVVTNDTLSGYNNYSDIDGQLGTTMTPTEATNGKTVALSDGVVHEVTTKPVGTTNGEFSAVVSNAVTVDLSGGGETPINFQILNGVTKSGETYTDDTASAYGGWALSEDNIVGDFSMRVSIGTLAEKGTMFGFKQTISDDGYEVPNPIRFGGMWQNSTGNILVVNNGNPTGADVTITPTPDPSDTMTLTNSGESWFLYFNDQLIHSFGPMAVDDVYPFITPFTNNNVNAPVIL